MTHLYICDETLQTLHQQKNVGQEANTKSQEQSEG